MFSWETLWPILVVAFGITYVITGSTIGYWVRAIFCFLTKWNAFTRYWWPVVTCPPCNAFWSAGAVAFWVTRDPVFSVEAAVVHCGFVGVLQAFIGGNGIAPEDEDFEEILGVEV